MTEDNGTIKRYDIKSLLCGEERDFLVRNNGDQVKVRDLEGKVIGLYFSRLHIPDNSVGSFGYDELPGRRHCKFTRILLEAYDELSQKYSDFEVVFVTDDWDEECFCKDFSGMPWLSIPFADSATRERLCGLFSVGYSIPVLVVLDKNGEVANSKGVKTLMKYGSEAYPFTQERIDFHSTYLEDAKRNQTLRSVLVSSSRDFLISNNGTKVPVSDLEGKIVGLFFSDGCCCCNSFTSNLVKIYRRLKDREESFEVVIVPLDDDESSFQLRFSTVPWLAIPFKDKSCDRLYHYFELHKIQIELEIIPTLVVIGSDGKTLVPDAVEILKTYGDQVYPFSLQKMEELAEKEKSRMKSPNLESRLVSWEGDYVIGNDDVKIPVSNLVGKDILLYFDTGVHTVVEFLPKLIETYSKIKAKDTNFELIFIPSKCELEFDNHFSSVPWLCIPYDHDERAKSVADMLNISEMPSLVAIGPTGWTITEVDIEIVRYHGADAYPFTEEHLREVASQWPERLHHPLHNEHVLVPIVESVYVCEACREIGFGWSFSCEYCRENCRENCCFPHHVLFFLHPKCALKKDPNKEG